jgi:glycosyltransferase involved in cell wall biosynthesis
MDEQIFAIQTYGGISRMFAELAREFVDSPGRDLTLLPLHAPIINRYVLENRDLVEHLHAVAARNQWTALARYMTRLRVRIESEIVHNTFYLPHGLTPTRGAKRIVTVHDMIPELLPGTRRRLDFLTLKRRYVETADHVICVSEATRDDLLRVYGDIRAPISVVHHGVDPRFHPEVVRADFLPERYLLFVGNRSSYKDARVLFEAFGLISREDRDLRLLCVGGSGLTPKEVELLQMLGIRERVSQRHLADDDMTSAYAHATAFVFPSRFEGFGLPAVEAMACGTPVILARATSLPEVGGDAAAYFEPADARELASVLREIIGSEPTRSEMKRRGLARAATFTWARSADLTAEAYRMALG